MAQKEKLKKKKEKKKGELIMSYIKRETVSLSPPCSLMRSQGSLLVSSHASIMNAAPLPPPSDGRLSDFFFFLTASSYQVKRAELYLYDENLLIISCQHSWRCVRFGRPPTACSAEEHWQREAG